MMKVLMALGFKKSTQGTKFKH